MRLTTFFLLVLMLINCALFADDTPKIVLNILESIKPRVDKAKVEYRKKVNTENDKMIDQENVHSLFSFASPYLELMEDFTFRECVSFQGKFRKWKGNLDEKQVIELSGLNHAADKQIKNFSSGMKQRAKLSLAILSDSRVLLLDEPCSNLDTQGQEWYATLINDFREQQTVIVCSNLVKEEYFFCNSQLQLEALKPSIW